MTNWNCHPSSVTNIDVADFSVSSTLNRFSQWYQFCFIDILIFYNISFWIIFYLITRLHRCWWQMDVDDIILLTIFECWWQLFDISVIFWKLVTECSKIEDVADKTGQNHHQHLKVVVTHFVTNICHQYRCSLITLDFTISLQLPIAISRSIRRVTKVKLTIGSPNRI